MSDKKVVSKIVTELQGFSAKNMKALTLEITSLLIEDTPRKYGWARSNWIPQVKEPYRATDGTPLEISTAAQQKGLADIATKYRLTQGPIYISNNVPYIRRLNEGYSAQAPAGFVQIARDQGLANIKAKIIK